MISILSTDHGRLRREQRDITKRSLYKALIYGTRERTWGQRWKIEYDGIIFIVNDSMTQEVTAYPAPLTVAPVDTKDRILHHRTQELLSMKPDLCTSHTVLVVDNSGSMTTHDILLHRDRQVAAYSVTAMEFVAEQLFKQTATNSDVVTLIEFERAATRVFTRESFDWILYNKLLARRDSRTFKQRQLLSFFDQMNGDTNYLEALDAADKALKEVDHDRCALSLFFLSDGAPTDHQHLRITPDAARELMCGKMSEMAKRYADKLNVHMVGFGASHRDFSVLQSLVEAVRSANNGAKAEFTYCDKVANRIGSAISSLVSSTTMTRTHLMTGNRSSTSRAKRELEPESNARGLSQWSFFRIQEHFVYDRGANDFVHHSGLPPGAFVGAEKSFDNVTMESFHGKPPPFLAINKGHCGKGAERVAFRCQLAVKDSDQSFVLNTMVAKETIHVDRPVDNVEFHRSFCEAQDLSNHLADEFNSRCAALPWYDAKETPMIVFLPCSILVLDDPEWPGRGVLVEKKLNVEKYGWQKYNDNAGGIDGKYYHAPLDIEREFARLEEVKTMIIEEESEEEESSDDEEDAEETIIEEQVPIMAREQDGVKPTDYLQAFTHFTYLVTNKQVMVCDLQGVYNYDLVPPTFELTDPAIHYKSKTGKKNVFGRTDGGEAGMDLFFKTHRCSKICKLMQLNRRNKNWKKKWRADNRKAEDRTVREEG